MLWLLFKIYYIMINDHVHCFDNQSIYEWETDLPAVMNWIVKKALTMMISFKICLRIMLQFCFLFNQDQKKKSHLFCSNKHPTGLIRRTNLQIQKYRWFFSAVSCLHDLSATVSRYSTRVLNLVHGGMSPTFAVVCFQVLGVRMMTSLKGVYVAIRPWM